MSPEIVSWLVSGVVLASALLVVVSRNLVHGVLWLGVTLLATALLYVGLQAPFVAAVQVLLYAGGVVILLIFGVMLTRRHDGIHVEAKPASPWRGLLVAVPLAAAGVRAVMKSEHLVPVERGPALPVNDIGRALMSEHVLAFEILSLLLLAAMVGAIVIARRRDPVDGAQGARGEGV